MNKSILLTLLIALNSCFLSAAQSHNIQQQEYSWQKYLPTKKQVFIGACTVVAAGVALWYLRCAKKVNSDKPFFRPSNSIAPMSPKQAPTPAPLRTTSGITQTQPASAPASFASPSIQQQTAVTKSPSIKVDLQKEVISRVSEKQQPTLPSKFTGIGTIHTFSKSNHIKCLAYNGGRELDEFCFDTDTQKIFIMKYEADCVHLRDRRILRNVDHILKHPTEITLGKRKVTFTGPWTMEIEG